MDSDDLRSVVHEGTGERVAFPAAVAADRPAVASPRVRETRGDAAAAILVVDDDPIVLRVIADVLRSSGYCVVEADSAAEAQRIVSDAAAEVRLLLTDLSMPAMNGFELVWWFRRQRPAARIIMMTGSLRELNEVVERADPIPLLVKPFTPVHLLSAVRIVLGRDNVGGWPDSHHARDPFSADLENVSAV